MFLNFLKIFTKSTAKDVNNRIFGSKYGNFVTLFLILCCSSTMFCGCSIMGLEIPTATLPSQSLTSQDSTRAPEEPTYSLSEPIPEPALEPIPEPEPSFEEYDITIMAVGDNLMHMGIVSTGRQDDGSYNFDCLYTDISDYLAVSDIKIINQETIFGGNDKGFSGYPYFNSPTEVGDAIVNAGFNVVLQSTNHTADQGSEGMDNAIAYWNTHPEMLVCGLHSPEESDPPLPVITIKDKTFAILNYTYGPNMGSVPKDWRGYFDILCEYDESNGSINYQNLNPKVLEDIRQADTFADAVIVCPHWGTEYATTPSSYQKSWALEMAQAGADVIIGTHPHVPEPIETITADNGNTCLCYYSLGNYVSTQQDKNSMLEGLAFITYHVTEDEMYMDTEKTGVFPLVCQYSAGPLRFKGIYPLEDYTEELASQHGIRSWGGCSFHLSDMQDFSAEVFGSYVLSKDILSQ